MVVMLVDDDLDHPLVINSCFVPLIIEVVTFGAYCFGVRHHLVYGIVGVDVIRKIAEVRKGSEGGSVYGFEQFEQQIRVG